MADPVTLAAISMGTTAAGGLIAGIGAKQSADANAAAYNYKAGVALLNKQINEQNANWALQAGGAQGVEYGLKAGQEIGATKAQQGASGIDVNTGSAKIVRDTQTNVAAFDQNVINWNAAKEAYGYRTRATMDVAESQLDTMAADQSKKAGTLAMVSSFLGAGANVSSKWLQGSQSGLFSSGGGGNANPLAGAALGA